MEKLSFVSYEDIAEYMFQLASDDKDVTAVVFYDDAKELFKELAMIEDTTIDSAEIHSPKWDGYEKEYYITLNRSYEIFVEKAYHETNEYHEAGYLYFGIDEDEGVALLDGDVDSRIIKAAGRSLCYEIEIDDGSDFEEECDGNCAECKHTIFSKQDEHIFKDKNDLEDKEEELKEVLIELLRYLISEE